jgi:hypothetical protein
MKFDLNKLNKDFKKYVFSQPLSTALATIKKDLYVKYISKTEKIYINFNNFKLNDNVTITAIILDPTQAKADNLFVLAVINGVSVIACFDIDFNNPEACITSRALEEEKIYDNLTKIISSHTATVTQFASNALIYLNSGNPDMRSIKEVKIPRKDYKVLQNTRLPVKDFILVGMNFKKPPLWNATQTEVSGHFRWQPCGVKLSKVKLIFIDPYIKTFSNTKAA